MHKLSHTHTHAALLGIDFGVQNGVPSLRILFALEGLEARNGSRSDDGRAICQHISAVIPHSERMIEVIVATKAKDSVFIGTWARSTITTGPAIGTPWISPLPHSATSIPGYMVADKRNSPHLRTRNGLPGGARWKTSCWIF